MEDADTRGRSSEETNLLRGNNLTTDSKFKGDVGTHANGYMPVTSPSAELWVWHAVWGAGFP